MKNTVQVTIFGQQYTIRSEASPEEIERVAAFVNENLSRVSSSGMSGDSLNTAILALLNVSGTYLQLRDGDPSSDDLSGWFCRMSSKLERFGIPVDQG